MTYVKHPTLDGDGFVSIAMPDGSNKQLEMREGVIEWPEGVPIHSSFKEAAEPEALREIIRQKKRAELDRLAQELGLIIGEQTTDDSGDKEPTVVQLREKAKELGVPKYQTLKKDELKAAIDAATAN